MTAIFAYTEDEIAFIAADTRRATAAGLMSAVAAKVHRWSEYILLAQTGAGTHMTRLVQEMMLLRDKHSDRENLEGLTATFKALREKHYAEATKQSKYTVAGTLLAACAADGISPAQIVTFDFANGQQATVTVGGEVYAHGSNPSQFLSIARAEISKARASSPVELDRWAMSCIEKAAQMHASAVGWPADIAIARPDPPSTRLIVLRRVRQVSEPPHQFFAL
jgi:hypothetical protein